MGYNLKRYKKRQDTYLVSYHRSKNLSYPKEKRLRPWSIQLVSQSQKTNCSRYRTCPSSQRCKPSFPQRFQRRSNRQEDQEINLACPSIQYCITVLYFRINFSEFNLM